MNKRIFTNILLAVLLLLSAVGLFINSGFYYTYYQPSVVVQFNDSAKLSQFSGNNGVAFINRQLNQVVFQYTQESDVKQQLESLNIKTEDFSITQTQQILSPIWAWTWLQGATVAIFAWGIVLYAFYYRFANLKQFLIKYINLLVNSGLGLLVLLGFLSWISRFYSLSQFSLMSLFSAFIAFAVLTNIKFVPELKNQLNWVKTLSSGTVITVLLVIVLFPTSLWLDSIIILFGFWIIPVVDYLLTGVTSFVKLPKFKLPRLRNRKKAKSKK